MSLCPHTENVPVFPLLLSEQDPQPNIRGNNFNKEESNTDYTTKKFKATLLPNQCVDELLSFTKK